MYKSGLARISENTPKYAGVVVFSSKDIPLVRFFVYILLDFVYVDSVCLITYLKYRGRVLYLVCVCVCVYDGLSMCSYV